MADKIDESAVRREVDAVAATWARLRSAYGSQPVIKGPSGTRLFDGLSDVRRKLSGMLRSVASHVGKVNKSTFTYVPHLGGIRPQGPPPAPLEGTSVYINLERAERLRAVLSQAVSSFGQHRSGLNTLFFSAPGGAPSLSALQVAAQRSGELSNDLRLRLEYARAADKISFFGQGDERAAAFPDFSSASEAQTAVNQANAALKQRSNKKEGGNGLFDRALDKATKFGSEYAKTVWGNAGDFAKSLGPVKLTSIALHPKDWWNKEVKANWETLKFAVDNPVSFGKEYGKQLLSWDDWRKNPARALGNITSTVVIDIALRRFHVDPTPGMKPRPPGIKPGEPGEYRSPFSGRNSVKDIDGQVSKINAKIRQGTIPKDLGEKAMRDLDAAFSTNKLNVNSYKSQFSKLAKSENATQVQQNYAEIQALKHVIDSGNLKPGTQVFTHASADERIHFGDGTSIDISPVEQADVLFKDADGRIHIREAKGTAKALREKLDSSQFKNLQRWRKNNPDHRIEYHVGSEDRWTNLLGKDKKRVTVIQRLARAKIPLTFADRTFTPAELGRLDAKLALKRSQWIEAGRDEGEFYTQPKMRTIEEALRYADE